MEQTARGFGGISGCSRGRGAGLGPARESQKPAGFVDRFTQIAEIAVMADQVNEIAMFAGRGIAPFAGSTGTVIGTL